MSIALFWLHYISIVPGRTWKLKKNDYYCCLLHSCWRVLSLQNIYFIIFKVARLYLISEAACPKLHLERLECNIVVLIYAPKIKTKMTQFLLYITSKIEFFRTRFFFQFVKAHRLLQSFHSHFKIWSII